MRPAFLMYFLDPILRGPTIASMLMCLAASLAGVLLFLRRQCLLGEALSHASYPGLTLAIVLYGLLFEHEPSELLLVFVLIGSFLSSLAGLYLIDYLQKKQRMHSDAALCFVLSVFFAIGLTAIGYVQFSHSRLYVHAQSYLYGQVATMHDNHIWIYAVLCVVLLLFLLLFYKEIEVLHFDRDFAVASGINAKLVDGLFFFILVFAVVLGIRSVGVVLLSAMFVAPALAARQYTQKLKQLFFLSAFFALMSGFFGIYCSIEMSYIVEKWYGSPRLLFPAGPLIVLIACFFALFSVFLAPKRGLFFRYWRILLFQGQCLLEHILKTLWRFSHKDAGMSLSEISMQQGCSKLLAYLALLFLRVKARVFYREGRYALSKEGKVQAAQIVRLHRLWELYLVNDLGFGVEKVHKSAEEMEHVITPEVERILTHLLGDPKQDPHFQPIPEKNLGKSND